MPRSSKCLGIDIGASSVKIAEIVTERSGARVTKLAQAELNLPPGPMDAQRLDAIGRVVRDLIKENKITTRQAVFCVPGQSVFIRRIKVPRTTEERLHRIVAYEARQQIPFALDNSMMEYQVFDYGDAAEVEVLLVAIKKDIVTDFMRVVNKTGVKPLMISVSSLALFNFQIFDSTPFEEFQDELARSRGKSRKRRQITATEAEDEAAPEAAPAKKGFSFKMPKLNLNFGKKKAAAAAAATGTEDSGFGIDTLAPEEDVYEEVRAYVNIGAQTFDLAIARLGRHKMVGFTRSVPYAGNELTRTLQDKLGLESSVAAEEIKRSRAIVIVPGREEEVTEMGADPDASEFTTGWADRLIIDLRKSFDFYISQPDGMAVDGILLSGGQALQRNLPGYIEDKLGIPVDIKTQVENAALKMPDSIPGDAVTPFVVAVGLGLTGVGYGQVNIDFLPRELKTIREFKKKNIEVILLVAAIVGMLFVSSQIGDKNLEGMQTWLRDNETKINTVQQTKKQIDDARKKRDDVNKSITSLGQAVGDRSFWLEFLGMIEKEKPADILITSMKMKPDGTIDARCETTVISSIAEFQKRLQEQKSWIQKIDLSQIEGPALSQYINKQVFSFAIHMKVLWKKSRLDAARATLQPGMLTPSPTPVATTPPSFGGPGGPGGPGALPI